VARGVRISHLSRSVVVIAADAPRALAELTAAERAVVALAVEGLSNAEIAAHRECAPRTVANLLARAYRKLGVTSRGEAAALLLWEGDGARPTALD
jgi:DNA-binding CsgD family transcriptional regulator